jgi:hypothetical protein
MVTELGEALRLDEIAEERDHISKSSSDKVVVAWTGLGTCTSWSRGLGVAVPGGVLRRKVEERAVVEGGRGTVGSPEEAGIEGVPLR